LSLQNKPTTALTGATGFLGSHLMASMLTTGYRIIALGRSNKEGTLKERIFKLMRWFGIEALDGQLELVEIDFLKPFLGLPESEYKELCAKTEQIIHCASDTSFSERKRENVFKSNVASLKGILDFAEDSKADFFHYISTAYVAGTGVTYCKEILSSAKTFTNVYEESKAAAENIISRFCQKNSITLSIIRPSIVYGDSQTGRSLKFNALYFPIRSAQSIRDIYLNDLNNNGGIKAAKNGIYIDKDGYLFLPLKIYLPEEGDLNIIPVDYFVNATIKIIENCSQGGIYHLTNNLPTTMKIVAKYYEQLMKVRGVEIIYGLQPDNLLRNPAEELFDRFIEPYRPYLSDNRVFDRTNTRLATDNLNPPEFTYEIFKTCMEYAITVNWGQSIF
jgi:Putative dehydrogenase domain of multifunctional non-ribosomal peptide synthetases and related enzymes